jgi:putative MATE family efflux protein
MKTDEMTSGPVTVTLLRFALPVMLGDLFQQLYITTDSFMLGRLAGPLPLAAVGSTTFLIRMIIGLFTGVSVGACVVVAQCAGAGDSARLRKTVHTLAALTIAGGVALTICGVLSADVLLGLVKTPDEIRQQAAAYLRIYFSGSVFELVYTVAAGIMQACGDSKRPFLYLVISSIGNVAGDYVLIGVLHLGTAGAAAATVFAQAVSAVLAVIHLCSTHRSYRLSVRAVRIDPELVAPIVRLGLPAGFQNVIVSFSNVIIQGYVNSAGTAAVGGFGLFNKVDSIIMLPLNSIAVAAMTFTGQNFGAGKHERIFKGMRIMFILNGITWCIGMGICLIFGTALFALFTDDQEIIRYAMLTLWYDMPCYWALGMGIAMTGIIRAMGHSRVASGILIVTMCLLRQGWIAVSQAAGLGLDGVLVSYPVSWILLLAGTIGYVLYLKRKEYA